MRAKPPADAHDQDLFRLELVKLIDQRHELVRLGGTSRHSFFDG